MRSSLIVRILGFSFALAVGSSACGGGGSDVVEPVIDAGADVVLVDSGNPCDACDPHATCTLGSTPLCACEPGFTGDGVTCADVDECAVNNGGCSTLPMVTCTNTVGSYVCGTCPLGYSGNGVTCVDIDECLIDNGGCSTDPLVMCSNFVGSSSCASCPTGFLGDGTSCTDIDECATNNGGCSSVPLVACHNTPGASSCDACPSGYTGTGMTCADVNECASNVDGCGANQRCSNVAGSFACVTCVGQEVLIGAPGANEACECAGRFIVDDYTVMDTGTNREWQRSDDATIRMWLPAQTYCANLVLGGKSDWRLPTVPELMGILDFSVGMAPWTNLCAFPTTYATPYWTADEVPGDPTKHWVIDFSDGIKYSQTTSGVSQAYRPTRCVR